MIPGVTTLPLTSMTGTSAAAHTLAASEVRSSTVPAACTFGAARIDYDAVGVGGIMGAATAYNLINQDPNLKVVMIEKDHSFQYSSTTNSDGNIRVQFNLPENIKISLYALEALKMVLGFEQWCRTRGRGAA